MVRVPRSGPASRFTPLALLQELAREAASRNSVPFPKVALPVRSNIQDARGSAQFPAAFAEDYSGPLFPQSVRLEPSRDLSPQLGNCSSFLPQFELTVFLTIFPLLMFDDRLGAFRSPSFIANRPSPIENSFLRHQSRIFPAEDYRIPGPTGIPSLLSPRPNRLVLMDFIILRIWKYCFKT